MKILKFIIIVLVFIPITLYGMSNLQERIYENKLASLERSGLREIKSCKLLWQICTYYEKTDKEVCDYRFNECLKKIVKDYYRKKIVIEKRRQK